MNYKEVYRFKVWDEIDEGKTVYCLDRGTRSVLAINDMRVSVAIALLNDAAKDSDRYEFWTEENENA